MEDRARAALVASCILLLAVSCGDGGPRRPCASVDVRYGGFGTRDPQLEILQRVATGGEPIGSPRGSAASGSSTPSSARAASPRSRGSNPATGTVVASIGVGAVPLEVLAAGDAVWVSNSADATVSRSTRHRPSDGHHRDVRGPRGDGGGGGRDLGRLRGFGRGGAIDPGTDLDDRNHGCRERAAVRRRGVRERVVVELP